MTVFGLELSQTQLGFALAYVAFRACRGALLGLKDRLAVAQYPVPRNGSGHRGGRARQELVLEARVVDDGLGSVGHFPRLSDR